MTWRRLWKKMYINFNYKYPLTAIYTHRLIKLVSFLCSLEPELDHYSWSMVSVVINGKSDLEFHDSWAFGKAERKREMKHNILSAQLTGNCSKQRPPFVHVSAHWLAGMFTHWMKQAVLCIATAVEADRHHTVLCDGRMPIIITDLYCAVCVYVYRMSLAHLTGIFAFWIYIRIILYSGSPVLQKLCWIIPLCKFWMFIPHCWRASILWHLLI